MKHTSLNIVIRLLLLGVFSFAGVDVALGDFGRFQIILDRRPFGDAPAPEAAPEPERTTGPSFADQLQLVAMTIRGGDIRVGLVDGSVRPPRTYFLFVGDEENGLRVVDADYEAETALVARDGDQRVLRMGGSGGTRPRATPGAGMIAGASGGQEQAERRRPRSRRMAAHISEGRRQRMEEEARRREIVPELTGAVLERHLQEYNVQAIREGMPPLPIPLTPEQDAQLVAEGVLPPLEE